MDYIARAVSADGFIRIFACRTTELVAEAARIHNTSATAAAALGRTLTAAAMMGAMIKDEGTSVTVKVDGGGSAGSILAVTDNTSMVRGYIENPAADVPSRADGHLDVSGIVGTDGFLTVTRDYGLKEPYSSSVPLVSGEIGDDLTAYFAASEQTPSAVGLGVLIDKDLSVKCAGGFIVQLMPGASEEHADDIEKAIKNFSSVTEALSEGKTPEQIAESLVTNQTIFFYENIKTAYFCPCSKERMARALISLGKDELEAIIREDHKAELSCRFCNNRYTFREAELTELLKAAVAQGV